MTTQTELQKQIVELKAEVVRFRGFAEATNYGFGTTEFTGVLTYANPALARMLDADSPEEVVGKNFFSLAPEKDAKEFESVILPSVMEKGQWIGERPILSLKGKLITTEQNIFLIYDKQGTPAYVANIIADITELEQTEKALRESEERYRAFSDAATEGLILHKDGVTIDVNRSFLDMYGYNDPSELIGKNVIELTIATPRDREKVYQNIKSGDTGPYEVMSKRVDGTAFPVEINARQIHYRGELVRVAAAMNITGRKQAEAERERLHQEIIKAQKGALRESEERYRAFSDATTEGILLHKDGITLDVNRSFLDMYGYSDPSELVGKNAIELTIATPKDREKIYQNVRSGGTGPYEVMAKRADGTTFPIEVNARQTHFKGETVRVVLIKDLTRRKQAEAERERLQQEAIDAQKRAIQELSTPIIPVMERIIVMPLIGSIDTLRARDITRALLAGIREHRAKVVIVDITGVPVVDSGVAACLNKTIQAARLKGARTIVTGISDAVAETIVDLGIDWGGIETLSDLQTGLVVALNRLGIKLVKGR